MLVEYCIVFHVSWLFIFIIPVKKIFLYIFITAQLLCIWVKSNERLQLHLLHITTHFFNVITIPITTHYNYRSLVCCVMLQTRSHWTWHPPSVIDWWATKANDLHVLLNNISLAIRQSLCNVWLQPNFDL